MLKEEMSCLWLKTSPNFMKGISTVNLLDDSRFEQFVRRIVSKMKLQESKIFNEDEMQKLETIFRVEKESLLMSVKTLVYMFKRLLKFVLMPQSLKNDLKTIGLNNEKADMIVKIYSAETKSTLDELNSELIANPSGKLDFSWKVNAEVSSDCCKKTKVPKAYVSLTSDKDNIEIEATHSELYSMFLQFEAIQNELDNLDV